MRRTYCTNEQYEIIDNDEIKEWGLILGKIYVIIKTVLDEREKKEY